MRDRIKTIALILVLALSFALFSACGARDADSGAAFTYFDPYPETEPASDAAEQTGTEDGTVSPEQEEDETEPAAAHGDFIWKSVSDGTVWLDAYKGVDAVVRIPAEDPVSGKTVTGIDVWAFRDNATVKEVVIPETVKVIEKNAFMYCSSLETVDMPDQLDALGDQAFYRCTALKRIDVPEGVKSVGYAAFMYCESLEEVVLPMTLEEICSSAFAYCSSLYTINSRGSDSDWTHVTVADGAMPPTWYTINYYYGQW